MTVHTKTDVNCGSHMMVAEQAEDPGGLGHPGGGTESEIHEAISVQSWTTV